MASEIMTTLYVLTMLAGFLLTWFCFVWAVVAVVRMVKAWRRRRRIDRRIIALAQLDGVWDRPLFLGGRALELKAWKEFRIKREPEETDAQLRRRCMEKADAQYRKTNAKSRKADGYTTKIMHADERHEEEPK